MSLKEEVTFTSNIITTNRNSTAIAPTYMTTNIKDMNSQSSKNNKPADAMKHSTRKSTEYTVLFTLITSIELITNVTDRI